MFDLYFEIRKRICPYEIIIKNIPPKQKILDIGCGQCVTLEYILKNKDFVKSDDNFSSQKNNTLRDDALNALSSLGISRNISRVKVDQILNENENISLESLIKEVLKKS